MTGSFTLLGHTDQGGRPDGVQLMLYAGYAYIGHMFSDGISVVDVRDPRAPTTVAFLPSPPNTRSHHLQIADGIMLSVNSANVWAMQNYQSQQDYFTAPLADSFTRRERNFTAGLKVYDLTDPAAPREVGFCAIEGIGLHRIWWTGGRYAYASALLDGFIDHIFIVIDMADPTKPVECGRWWIPGMNLATGEIPHWKGRWALHHAVVEDDIAYASWRDGGLTILDVSDKTKPRLLAHKVWSPPFGGGTHSALPLHDRNLLVVADEATMNIDQDQMKHTWVFDIRDKSNPISISTFPTPSDQDYVKMGGQFGPHNLHENRPGSFQSSTTLFATWQSAGVRVFDIANAYRPEEIGYFVPPQPTTWREPMRGRAKMRHTADLFVSKEGLIYATDYDAGLYILQWDGA